MEEQYTHCNGLPIVLGKEEHKRYTVDDEAVCSNGADVSVTDATGAPSEGGRSSEASELESQLSCEDNRDKFITYWKSAVQEFGISADGMMLRNSVNETGLSTADREEVLRVLTENIKFPIQNFVELGAGIGRLTPYIQTLCEKAVVVDFLEEYIAKNKAEHYDAKNRPDDKFLCADAVKLELAQSSFDVVFWNWLLMYLTDEEVVSFVTKAALWTKPGGFIFCRESCGTPSDGNPNRPWAAEGNPTNYRDKKFYTHLLKTVLEESGGKMEAIITEREVNAYSKKSGSSNNSQFMWLLKRSS